MPARLNRRRYRHAVNALQDMIADPKTPPPRKLEAVKVLLGIFDRHDQSEARRERREAQAAGQMTVPDTEQPAEPVTMEPDEPQDAELAAKMFLERLNEVTVDE